MAIPVTSWLSGAWSYMTGQQTAKLSGAPEDLPTTMKIAWSARADAAGEAVNTQSTLGLSVAWACIQLKSELVGSMGVGVYSKQDDGGRVSRTDHWLYDLLHEEPNLDQTPAEFWAGQVAALDLYGNAYAEIMRVGERATALTPLVPMHMAPRRRASGERYFEFQDRGKTEELPADKVLHLRGVTLGGDVGLSPIDFGRRTIGSALAANRTAADMFRNGLQNSGFMETGATKLLPEQRADLIETFSKHTGRDMAGKILPLEKDFKFVPLTMKATDAELLMSRRWDVEEICRLFAMLPILIGHAAQGQTMWGSGIEQLLLGWQTLRLNPILRRIEQSLKKQLLPAGDRKTIYPEFNREAVMAMDSAGRAALYSAFGQNGILDRNEMRAFENRDARPGGEFLTVQSNLIRLDQLGAAGAGASSEQQLRSALLNMLGVAGGDVEAMIEAKVNSMLGHNGGPRLGDGE